MTLGWTGPEGLTVLLPTLLEVLVHGLGHHLFLFPVRVHQEMSEAVVQCGWNPHVELPRDVLHDGSLLRHEREPSTTQREQASEIVLTPPSYLATL